jgi:hypothetical protein
MQYSLGAAEEEVKVPELEAHPLPGLSDELVAADEVLGVGARIRRREDVPGALDVRVDGEGAGECRRGRSYLVFRWWDGSKSS